MGVCGRASRRCGRFTRPRVETYLAFAVFHAINSVRLHSRDFLRLGGGSRQCAPVESMVSTVLSFLIFPCLLFLRMAQACLTVIHPV
jgi:hypothetical protein